MNKLIRLYNQNRKLFMLSVIMIIAVLSGIYILNFILEQTSKQNYIEGDGYSIEDRKTIQEGSYQISTGESQDSNLYVYQSSTVQDFIDRCNKKEYERAYYLVSDECKEIEFPTIEDFKEKYVDEIFNENKTCTVQAWSNNIYLVKITEDLLATGKTTEDSYIEEYITVVGSDKLNINSYMGSRTLDVKVDKANVEISAKKIYFYMDYAIIDINVNNQRKTPILLDSREESGNIYLKDEYEIQYECEDYNMDLSELIVEADLNKDLSLKFDLPYSKYDQIETINFSKILADYNQYKQIGDSRLIEIELEI